MQQPKKCNECDTCVTGLTLLGTLTTATNAGMVSDSALAFWALRSREAAPEAVPSIVTGAFCLLNESPRQSACGDRRLR